MQSKMAEHDIGVLNKKQPVNRKQKPLAKSSSSYQPVDKKFSDHQEDDNIDLPPPTIQDTGNLFHKNVLLL